MIVCERCEEQLRVCYSYSHSEACNHQKYCYLNCEHIRHRSIDRLYDDIFMASRRRQAAIGAKQIESLSI